MLEEDGEAFLNIDRTLHGTVDIKGKGKKKGKRWTPAEIERERKQAELFHRQRARK